MKEALKLALELKNSASAYWTEKEISIIEKLIDALAQPEQEPLTDEAKAVIAAAKVAMDASFETENRELDISIPAHLATALSLRLDEFEAALRSKNT